MKILFIGGNGNISWCCSKRAVELGHEVFALNRGVSSAGRRPLPAGVTHIKADIRDAKSVRARLKSLEFDAVVDFLCYAPEHAAAGVEMFGAVTKQFVFISSTANYQRNPTALPFSEAAPLGNSGWLYAKNKIACEEVFMRAYRDKGFPVTIVRPGHTYDTIVPDAVGYGDWTVASRIIAEKPVVIHGDGTSLWTLTHSRDFANALVRLLGDKRTIGESYHITSDELLTWREVVIKEAIALGAKRLDVVFIPSTEIMRRDPGLGSGLLGHKSWCDIYDNSKIKSIAPGWRADTMFGDGIAGTFEWFRQDPKRQAVNPQLNSLLDGIISEFKPVCLAERLL